MRILFLVYHGFSEHSGISKKIHYQVKGLRENGHDVRLCYYGFAPDGHRCRYVDDQVLKDYGMGKLAGLRQRIDYEPVYEYCKRENIEFVYARCFMNATPWLIRFFKKLKQAGIKAVTEIPTYPYDHEFDASPFGVRMGLKVDKLFRRRLSSQMDAIVTFSDEEEIFGQRTIRISNGVDFDSIPLLSPAPPSTFNPSPSTFNPSPSTFNPPPSTFNPPPSTFNPPPSTLHLIAVAEVHVWHGYDRILTGLGEYYKNGGQCDVVFHIVGGVHPNERYKPCQWHPGLQAIIDKYDIGDHVVFHGTMFGDELTAVFNQCQFAVGSLGRHRSGITVIKTLKNREYATRGIPFIYSEQDSDFDNQPYVIKAPADESPVDIQQILDFMDSFTMKPEEIRRTVEHLTWKIQMQKVIDVCFAE